MHFTARKLSPQDVEAVVLLEEMFPDAWGESGIQRELSNKTSRAFVLLEGNEIIGFCAFTAVREEANLNTLVIHPLFQRKGAASTLVTTAFQSLQQEEVREVYLEVRASNEAAIKLYEKLGFEKTGIRPGFYTKPTEDAVTMHCIFANEVRLRC